MKLHIDNIAGAWDGKKCASPDQPVMKGKIMGTIKDLVDLTTQLANSIQDRRITSELSTIQTLILNLQSEQAELHETNMRLRQEKLALQEQIQELKEEISELRSSKPIGPHGVPICPNCSTDAKPVYMSPLPRGIGKQLGATHHCPKCKFMGNSDQIERDS